MRVSRDLYKPAHRHYSGLLATDVRTGAALVRPDTVRWQAAVEAHVRDRRFDAVVESALADSDDFSASSLAYRAAGHRIEVATVATTEALSQLGTVGRFLTETANGQGRTAGPRSGCGMPACGLPAEAAGTRRLRLRDQSATATRPDRPEPIAGDPPFALLRPGRRMEVRETSPSHQSFLRSAGTRAFGGRVPP